MLPTRVEKVDTLARRATEIVTVVSDGRSVTSAAREQSEFLSPILAGTDGTQVSDEVSVKKVAALVSASAKHRVLASRPQAPDSGASADRAPLSVPGTYVLFNTSAPLVATVWGRCDQPGSVDQRWTFTAESDPGSGQLNCAVEPSKTNAIAHLVWTSSCS